MKVAEDELFDDYDENRQEPSDPLDEMDEPTEEELAMIELLESGGQSEAEIRGEELLHELEGDASSEDDEHPGGDGGDPAVENREENAVEQHGRLTLCAASRYTEKYFLNPQFETLPEAIKKELQVTCVLYTADVGGTIELYFDPEGNLKIDTAQAPGDYLYDEIGSVLKVKQILREKRDLFEGLELYYRIFFLGEKEDLKAALEALEQEKKDDASSDEE